jgi:hypothetical protein
MNVKKAGNYFYIISLNDMSTTVGEPWRIYFYMWAKRAALT